MANGEPRATWRGRLERGYRALALLSLNTLIVLLGLNLAAAVALAYYRQNVAPPSGSFRYRLEKLLRAYPGWSEEELEALLTETWQREYIYAPFVQHREEPISGRFLNIDPHGFRVSAGQGSWPPAEQAFNVFVFGGSTTFGYGLADEDTMPSRLQQALADHACPGTPRVYNFGRGNYYSEQERLLFEGMLAEGMIPDVALFVDGLNEFKEAPKFTGRLDYLLSESDGQLALRALKKLPAVQLLKILRERGRAGEGARSTANTEDADRELGEKIVRRWVRSKRLTEAVAGEFGVLPIFVWQPVPTYQYALDFHLFAREGAGTLARHGALQHGYRLMDRNRSVLPELELAGNFLWLADMQQGRREPLYVDAAHYTAAFSDEIARRIAGFIATAVPCARLGG